MISLRKQAKSKTIGFNALALMIIPILKSQGIELPVEAVTAFLTLGNYILRFFTDKRLEDK